MPGWSRPAMQGCCETTSYLRSVPAARRPGGEWASGPGVRMALATFTGIRVHPAGRVRQCFTKRLPRAHQLYQVSGYPYGRQTRLDQAHGQGQPGQVGAATAAGLIPDTVQVGGDRTDADIQFGRDLGVGAALGN